MRPELPPTLTEATLPDDDLVDDAYLRARRYDGVDLSRRTARLLDVDGCHLRGSTLAGGRLEKLTVIDTVFDHCDLANLTFDQSSLSRVELTGCRATGLVASGSLLRQMSLVDCIADLAVFRFATFTKVRLTDCRLAGADFVAADLSGATFRRCDLSRAELSQVKARGALFVDCTWDGVRGVSSLAGATIVHGSPIDAEAFMVATASCLGIKLGDPDDFPEDA